MSCSTRRSSSKLGTVNYSADEMRRLNAKVRVVLPLTGDDWLRVAYQFNLLRPEAVPYRDVESLKRKFKKMYCARGRALPDYVQEAKELRALINQRLDTAQEQEQEQKEQEASAGDLTLKLRQMEDAYHRTLESKRAEETRDGPVVQRSWSAGATSTAGVIAMLTQIVESKRRAADGERRERKRRKVEGVLLSAHQEQREHELAGGGNGSAEASTSESSSTTAAGHQNETSPALAASLQLQDSPSLGVMELLLQLMIAQQLENAQRLEAEQASRERERFEREERRHQKELQRKREHRELMLTMRALLGDRFPDSLKHYSNEDDEQQEPAAHSVHHVATPSQGTSTENGASSTHSPAQASVEPAAVDAVDGATSAMLQHAIEKE
ncbi:hypothetical protein PHYPSEUDO_003793 [Phytophthora pseudosyringae]|uniref:DUF6818 domain-containing protein n=1 Tax=Phytophthora pseudosyringae TaxID=221518 RepID=A0A8T1WGN6_9STRA|nr:hypothetical protein PHYPSEUDO_003793 [Phytophthora pseudosyringae]